MSGPWDDDDGEPDGGALWLDAALAVLAFLAVATAGWMVLAR